MKTTMDRIQEIDQLVTVLYGKIHEAWRDPSLGYRTDGIIDEYIEQIIKLSIERAYWEHHK